MNNLFASEPPNLQQTISLAQLAKEVHDLKFVLDTQNHILIDLVEAVKNLKC